MFRRKPSVHFVFAERFKQSGSTVMRGRQLCDIAAKTLGDSARVSYSPLDADLRNATLFLTKGALMAASPERLQQLKSAGNRLLFDVVDEVPPPTTRGFADLIVAASITAFVDLQRDYPTIEVALVNHHVDPRLARVVQARPEDALHAGYFGELVNAVLTPEIERLVTPVLVDTSSQSDSWLERLPEFNLHYAVRQTRGADHHKPFLKGFTAAHCRSNILIQRSQTEAVLWLGDDYPYLLDEEPTEADIIAALERIRDDFGSADWSRGLDVMRDIRERTSTARIGAEAARALS